jgi:hypothetical protein
MVLSTARIWPLPDSFIAEERWASKPARPTVYLDTTIPSYLTAAMSTDLAKARMQRVTRIWWSRYRPDCDIFISDCVLSECRGGNENSASKRLAALASIDSIYLSARSEALLDSLKIDGLIPEKAHMDAEHIAYAATNSVRFLLTWNCKHLANRMILRRVAQRCESHGFTCPMICTPEAMMRICAYERRAH